MTDYKMIDQEVYEEMAKCFSNGEEYASFVGGLQVTAKEIDFYTNVAARRPEDEDVQINISLQQIAMIVLFIRQNMDLIHQLVSKIKPRDMTKEELDRLKKDQQL
jgi:hypothetical protein